MRPKKLFGKRPNVPGPLQDPVSGNTLASDNYLNPKSNKIKKRSDVKKWLPFTKSAAIVVEEDNVVDILKTQLSKFGQQVFGNGEYEDEKVSSTSLITIASTLDSKRSSTVTVDPSRLAHDFYNKPDCMGVSEDEEQKSFILNVLNGNVYLHPQFIMTYKPLYCIGRSRTGFTCIYVSHFDSTDLVTVKFIKKSVIPSSEWINMNGMTVPIEVAKYITGEYKDLPVYRWHYEDSDYIYMVTEIRAHEKEAWQKTFLEKISNGIIGSKFNDIDWNKHYK